MATICFDLTIVRLTYLARALIFTGFRFQSLLSLYYIERKHVCENNWMLLDIRFWFSANLCPQLTTAIRLQNQTTWDATADWCMALWSDAYDDIQCDGGLSSLPPLVDYENRRHFCQRRSYMHHTGRAISDEMHVHAVVRMIFSHALSLLSM